MRILLLIQICLFSTYICAQETSDTTKRKSQKSISIKIAGKDTTETKTVKRSSKFSLQLTLSRIDLGLSRYTDNGSFTLSSENQFLESETWKSSNFGFEFFQMGYRFNSNFKVYLGGGLDWSNMRLKKDITILPDQPMLDTISEGVNFEKNRFSSTYLRLPLSFQLRTNDDQKGNKMYFVFGPEIGFLINGKVKQVSDERGKVKVKDDFNLNPFRYGAFARMGYDNVGVYLKYYNNDVFADNQGPSGLKNMAFGLMLGF